MGIIEFERPIILATTSPARQKLVSDVGISFISESVNIDETPRKDEKVLGYVKRMALEKAAAVIPPSLDAVIVTVDTAIGHDDKIIGKPADEGHARRILKELSGCTHEVLSAIAVKDMLSGDLNVEATKTKVKFTMLSDRIIDWYISTSEWDGRAGAYAIQGKGLALIESVEGCFSNVIGISIPSLIRMLLRHQKNF